MAVMRAGAGNSNGGSGVASAAAIQFGLKHQEALKKLGAASGSGTN